MPELGTKHECFSCGAKFYDFGRPQAICPKCGANQADGKAASPAADSAAKKRRRETISRRESHDEDDDAPAPVSDDIALDESEDLTEELGEAEEETLDEED